jgi:hypothetical protein
MPTVLKVGPYRFGFYSKENNEPPHIHVHRDRCVAKYWLEPLTVLSSSRGFRSQELNIIRAIVESNREKFVEAWREHFDQ